MKKGIFAAIRKLVAGLLSQNNEAILDQNGQPIFPQE